MYAVILFFSNILLSVARSHKFGRQAQGGFYDDEDDVQESSAYGDYTYNESDEEEDDDDEDDEDDEDLEDEETSEEESGNEEK